MRRARVKGSLGLRIAERTASHLLDLVNSRIQFRWGFYAFIQHFTPFTPQKGPFVQKEGMFFALTSRMQKGMPLRALSAVAFLIMRACTLVPMLKLRIQWAARVSLSDCFALGGKGTGGLKTPGYSKTVLRTENVAATPRHFGCRLFNNAGIRISPQIICTHTMGRQGQSFRLFYPCGQGLRGFKNPQILACKASQSERMTRMAHRHNLRT